MAAQMTLTTAHEQAVRQIQPHLEQLYREIEQAGEAITLSFLYQHRRIQTIKQIVERHINGFALFASMMSNQAQRQGVALGSQSGLAQVRGVADGQQIHTPSPDSLTALSEHQDSARARLFNGYGAEAAKDVARSLITRCFTQARYQTNSVGRSRQTHPFIAPCYCDGWRGIHGSVS